jgi:hypothetical protein
MTRAQVQPWTSAVLRSDSWLHTLAQARAQDEVELISRQRDTVLEHVLHDICRCTGLWIIRPLNDMHNQQLPVRRRTKEAWVTNTVEPNRTYL